MYLMFLNIIEISTKARLEEDNILFTTTFRLSSVERMFETAQGHLRQRKEGILQLNVMNLETARNV